MLNIRFVDDLYYISVLGRLYTDKIYLLSWSHFPFNYFSKPNLKTEVQY